MLRLVKKLVLYGLNLAAQLLSSVLSHKGRRYNWTIEMPGRHMKFVGKLLPKAGCPFNSFGKIANSFHID